MSADPDNFLLICTKCEGPKAAAAMRAALAGVMPLSFGFRAVACLAGCERPVAVGFQGQGKASYLFGDIRDEADRRALAAFAHQYAAHPTGWTSATDRPAALATKTLARLPGMKP